MAVTREQVLEAIRDQLKSIKVPEVDTVREDESILSGDHEVDSLDLVEVVKALEDKYGVTISDDDLKPVQTYRDAIDLTLRMIEEQHDKAA